MIHEIIMKNKAATTQLSTEAAIANMHFSSHYLHGMTPLSQTILELEEALLFEGITVEDAEMATELIKVYKQVQNNLLTHIK